MEEMGSIVTTNHWSCGSLKFSNVLDTVALTELLYQVPPLYHMNMDEFKKHQETMKRHYAFFSPIHRELGFLPMTGFAWLTPDHLVQRTVFGDAAELVANFSEHPFSYRGVSIPGRSILARWLKDGRMHVFTPKEMLDGERDVAKSGVKVSPSGTPTRGLDLDPPCLHQTSDYKVSLCQDVQ